MIVFPEQRVEAILDGLLRREGGSTYTDHPADRGGPTKYGMTEATARQAGYTGRMQDLTEAQARAIYRKVFVADPGFDKIMDLDPSVGAELIDTGVNVSPARAARFLQRWLNGFNVGGYRYTELKVDGNAGPATREALRAYIAWRGPLGVTALLRGLNGSQAEHYLALTEADRTQRAFLFGWVCNRVEIPA